jgi:hypothetical protein
VNSAGSLWQLCPTLKSLNGRYFEPGYLETDAPGAIFPMIRAADSALEYSHVLERRAQKNQLAILRETSRILEIRELTFTKQRQGSNFSRRIQSDSPQTHIGTLLAQV